MFTAIVLYRLSTSNHNSITSASNRFKLSYIVFLHQTTTHSRETRAPSHCLISSFYIKPQHVMGITTLDCIVLYRLSTSNHNHSARRCSRRRIVLYRLSTSNHNSRPTPHTNVPIVLYRLSTSNHNSIRASSVVRSIVLYRLSTSNHNIIC